jgi:hypothetical protein
MKKCGSANRVAAAMAFGFAIAAASAAQAVTVATISGGYDQDAYDTPELIFNNTTPYAFTNAQMVLTPYQAGTLDYSTAAQTVNLGTMNGGANTTVIWGNAGPFFATDWDDTWGNSAAPNAACVQPYPYCALAGNFKVTFTATWANPAYNSGAGVLISSVFSPTNNATGSFVGWEGLDPNGLSETVYDAHTGAITGHLADIVIGPPVETTPLPAALPLFASGLGVMGFLTRRRKRKGAAAIAA